MDSNNNNLTYKQSFNTQELMIYVKAVGVPAGVMLLGFIIISQFGAFGTNLLAPMAGAMWVFGAITAFAIPSQRDSTCNETHAAVISYLAGMWGFRMVVAMVAGTSNEQLMATYSQAMPVSSGSTIMGFLQTMLWITAVMTPIAFLGMQGKKLITFKRSMNKQKTIDALTGIRNSGKQHSDYNN